MAYFSNDTEAGAYESRWCERCIHWIEDKETKIFGCPVWDAHLFFNSDQLTKGKLNEIGDVLLMLIPETSGGLHADKCEMFIPPQVAALA